MGADRISTCPRCRAGELRENYAASVDEKGMLTVEYWCRCWGCGWYWDFDCVRQAVLPDDGGKEEGKADE